MSKHERFLLIRAWGSGFWSEMEHVSGSLQLAEMTHRIPVVFWGPESLYASENPLHRDSFTNFFNTLSDYRISDLEQPHFSYYPAKWHHGNLREAGDVDFSELDSIASLFDRQENVLVNRIHTHHIFSQLTQEGFPEHLCNEEKHEAIYRTRFRLQPEITRAVDSFYKNRMAHRHPILGVHIRGSDKVIEVPQLSDYNDLYPDLIEEYLKVQPDACIYLMTDSEEILFTYKERYGNRIISTPSVRTSNEATAVHFLPDYKGHDKGIDIVMDTYLALKCDHFIGAYYSNVSLAIKRLKKWPEGTLSLIGTDCE